MIVDKMSEKPKFISFGKIPRLNRDCVISEKLDGTNAQVFITKDGNMFFGSRNCWITVSNDNYGFAKWATAHKDDLLKLGPGHHFGEWWGQGIQHGYGLKEKRFSLFNTDRWSDDNVRPECCHVVPKLYEGLFDTEIVNDYVYMLAGFGSKAVPGQKAEGVIVYHIAARQLFKVLCENDEGHKG